MIFGGGKLTPLRFVPRCALPSVGSFNTGTLNEINFSVEYAFLPGFVLNVEIPGIPVNEKIYK
jgi:hypothetical protein